MLKQLKSRFNLKVQIFEKENDKIKLKKSEWNTVKRKEFESDYNKEKANGFEMPIEVVNEPPARFQFNHLYIRADGKVAYLFVLKED